MLDTKSAINQHLNGLSNNWIVMKKSILILKDMMEVNQKYDPTLTQEVEDEYKGDLLFIIGDQLEDGDDNEGEF